MAPAHAFSRRRCKVYHGVKHIHTGPRLQSGKSMIKQEVNGADWTGGVLRGGLKISMLSSNEFAMCIRTIAINE